MKILITGGTGLVGTKLLRLLDKPGWQISLLSEKEPDLTRGNITIIAGNLKDYASLEKACAGIDIVIHLAGLTHAHDQDKYFSINTEGTKNLLRACEYHRVSRFIFISSTTASAEGGGYAQSKLLAEEEVKKYGRCWTILRLAEVYGAGDKEAIAKLVKMIKNNRFIPVIGDGRHQLCPVHIDDVLSAIKRATTAQNICGKTYILSGPEELSYNQLIDRIENKLGVRRVRIKLPVALMKIAALISACGNMSMIYSDQIPRFMCAKNYDNKTARQDLGFNPQTLEAKLEI